MPLAPSVRYDNNMLHPHFHTGDELPINVNLPPGVNYPKGTVLGELTPVAAAVNEIQTVSITGATGGTFTLTFGGETTTAIAWDATADEVQAALEALSVVGPGNVLADDGPLPTTDVTIEFQKELAGSNQALMVIDPALLTGPDVSSVTETTPGRSKVGHAKYVAGNSDGTEVARCVLAHAAETDERGRIVNWGDHSAYRRGALAWFQGVFRTADLVGLDAAAVPELGKLLTGTTSDLSDPETLIRIGV